MKIIEVPVRIRASNGRSGGKGVALVAMPPLLRRIRKAGILFAIGLGGGLLFLPIPLIHLFGLIFFLAMSALAARRMISTSVLKGARGVCPSCGKEGSYFVGFGGKRLRWPVSASCPHCNVGLGLEPEEP
jgi:hypothetical protein